MKDGHDFILIGSWREESMIRLSLMFYRDRYLPMLREHIDECPYGLDAVDDMQRTINNLLEKMKKKGVAGYVEN